MINEFEAQVLSDLNLLKSQINTLVGDGNGGRMADLERRRKSTSRLGAGERVPRSLQRTAHGTRSSNRRLAPALMLW